MFTVISILFSGIFIGYITRRFPFWEKINRPITYTIYLLLFLLGISVGHNPQIMDNLATLGMQAFLLSVAGTLGSLCFAWLVYRFVFQRRKEAKE